MAKNTITPAKDSKEIVALSPFEAVRLRPSMYIGQVSLMEDKLALIIDGKLKSVEKKWSAGFMHLIVEVLENALDEAKRCNGKMQNVYVTVNLDTNEVSVTDEGTGFHNGQNIHSKTKKNIVRTALEELHAGSNFTDTDKNILGTHGVGAAVTNMLSEYFTVTTVNPTHYVKYEWKDFKVIKEDIRPKLSTEKLGTTISFIPTPELFTKYKWDKDLIVTYLSYKSFLIKNDPIIKNLILHGKFIQCGQTINIPVISDFIPENSIKVETSSGSIYLWESYQDSTSLSFINGSQCTGIHQKVVNDWCNEYFKYNLAHHFYETLISLNVPSKLMRFADQNKTKFATSRGEIEDDMFKGFNKRLLSFLAKSDIARNIENSIEDRLHSESLTKIKRAQKQSKRKISEKYSPSTRTKGAIFLTEGLSAAGGVKQARDNESEAVYALKGKVKNSKKLSDLSNNKELLEIISILDIEPNNKRLPNYEKIIIAADSDADGSHITSLIINFFYTWFPHVIDNDRLYQLITPLVVCDSEKSRKYFYSIEEYTEFANNNKTSNVNYLKGLGSLSLEDWKFVMDNRVLFKISNDRSAKRFLDIAFGASSQKRKKWLQS
jgi:DNA gyrase/topoisomerase IV subunit B